MDISELAEKAFTYAEYRELLNEFVEDQENKTEAQLKMLPYIVTNINLMETWDQAAALTEEMKAAVESWAPATWLVLTEGWCGDAANIIPLFQKIADFSKGKIKLRLLLRDENTALMDQYLTDGGRAIPKVIIYDEAFRELANWGPCPAVLHAQKKPWKEEAGKDFQILIRKVNEWYEADQCITTQAEILALQHKRQ
ncbi:thioredoxin family protein [Chitinophaga sp. SYP-B3965]|uniref:thioredoxin family protein n=1 Tax=Chitinophaga sp. SYP-B3965 TaxID=2663120 RepID=UPI001299CF30|nr:thioredoxin family protein [Chitinophaga sp. SYP-B3965]MRG44952.1 thioredoxin family protein [Chitinophaga sp. SYP-B3965]